MKQRRVLWLVLCLALLCTACGGPAIQPEAEMPPAQLPPEPPADLTDAEAALWAAPALDLPVVSADRLTTAVVEAAVPQEAEGPVIFIADGGTGDGSSPDAPLDAVKTGNAITAYGTEGSRLNYYDSLLYQATSKLYGTGGTIVLVGPVLCTADDTTGDYDMRDLPLPYLGGATVTITSVYDGVDYRETNNARLIIQGPVCLNLNNPTIFRDMDLCTQIGKGFSAANRLICCNGFPTVVDTGVQCYPLDADGNLNEIASDRDYPTIVGGHRYVNIDCSTDLTVRSGTFYMLSGSSYGAQSDVYGRTGGSSRLVVEGTTTVLGAVSAASGDPMAMQEGDATLLIRGGEFRGPVQICGGGGFSNPNCTATIRITGGTFSQGSEIKAAPRWAEEAPAVSLLDCSAYTGSLPAVSGFSQIAWPSCTEVQIAGQPHRTDYFTGDLLDLRGLSLTVTGNGQTLPLDYDNLIAGFRFFLADGREINPEIYALTPDDTVISVSYADQPVGTLSLTVTARPAVSITGVSILAGKERQELGFLFGVEEHDETIAMKECGILALPTALLREGDDLTRDIGGAYRIACSDLPADGMFTDSDTDGMLYAAVTDIPVEEYDRSYTAVAYYVFVHDGQLHTAYSQPCTASVYAVAKQTGGAPAVVQLTENGGVSTRNDALVAEKIEEVFSYFESMATLVWTSAETMDYSGNVGVEWVSSLRYEAGQSYCGIPYIASYPNGTANYENFTGCLDENGVFTGSTNWKAMIGNDCTSSVVQSMSRVSNHNSYCGQIIMPVANYAALMDNPAGPVVKVGDYTFDSTALLTSLVVADNDRQTIYEAYAAAQRGDYLHAIWQHGSWVFPHIRLISRVDVVRRADGTIDPSSSYIRIHEQTSTLNPYTKTSWNLDYALSFSELANQNYLPTRDASFDSGYFETPWCVVYDGPTRDTVAEGLRGEIVSNYDLSEVEVEVTDRQTGETVFAARDYFYFAQCCSLAELDPENALSAMAGTGDYEFVLRVTAANEQRELLRFVF